LTIVDDVKNADVDAGRITQRSYDEYIAIADIISDVLGTTRPAAIIRPIDLRKNRQLLCQWEKRQAASPVTFPPCVFRLGSGLPGSRAC
jgi:hypothetical protein